MDFPTEEELFELQHQDEIDAMGDNDPFENYEDHMNLDCQLFGPKLSSPPKTKIPKHTSKGDSTTTKDAEKENCSSSSDDVSHTKSARRKLLYESEVNLDTPLKEIEICKNIKQRHPSLQNDKRKASDLSDDDLEVDMVVAAKKTCIESTSTLESFMNNMLQSQARPSLFSESREKITITKSDGRRIYLCLNNEDEEIKNIKSFSQKTGSLLSVPINTLKTSYLILEETQEKDSEMTCLNDVEMSSEEVPEENSLWVEKYRPLSYMHLLSEEGINRTLLQWLKLWDKVVFGKERKTKKKVEPSKPAKFPKFGDLIEDLDEHNRPHHKVAFLSGPPGLGKTTLATIIARQAGYNVVEINASDDRNPEIFRTSLEAATQMKSVLHEDNKPNCLILDEIDGAPAASINVLIAFIKSVGIPKGKRKKGDIPLLMRPIVCICNDQYSPALKPLRQLSLVLNFPATTTSRLASRLYEVSSKEGLVADMAALTLLCEKTANDIRSCLSTLQFIHRKQHNLKIADIKGMHIGQKDMQKSLFAVWQDIFHFTDKKSFTKIFETIQAFGDYDKIFVGMFENYLNIKFRHRNLEAVWSGAEWACFGDIIQQQIAHSQLYFLMPYLPYPAVAFHMLFASNTYPHISYPSAFYENKSRSSQLSNTLNSLIKDMISSLKCFLNSNMLLVDVFPFLVEIIKPNLRPVNTQLYSNQEKSELRRVIELMLAFNLNYHQERSLEGTYNYVLDPNIEELIKFSDIKSLKKALTYSTKQMIAREVEMEQMRKGDSKADQNAERKTPKVSAKNFMQPKPQHKPEPERPVLDFFGRVVTPIARNESEEKKDTRNEDVWFHFKEGYSNAVRRTVYIKNLL